MKHIEFEFSVPVDHPSLAGHFPGNPIVPGVLVMDHVLRGLLTATGLRVTRINHVKFTSPLRPDEKAFAACEIQSTRVAFKVIARRLAVPVVLASGSLSLSAEC